MDRTAAVIAGVTGSTPSAGNAVEVFRNGDEIFPAMIESIRAAERTVDLLTYVYWTGDVAVRVADALADRARAGLRVRVVLDAFGCMRMDDELVEAMRDAGCHVEMFRTVDDRAQRLHHRTHRKLVVCDESVALTGGVGIAEEWEGDARSPEEWRDTHFRIRGPAVRELSAAFVEHWVEIGHPSWTPEDRFPDLEPAGDADLIVLRGSSGPFWHDLGLAMDALLRGAEERIRLTTAYFAPGERMISLLCDAADRGVSVELLLPGSHLDKRVVHLASSDEYERLMDCGVDIWHYEQTMLHAKVLTIDGEVSLIGSANIDERSMRHNEEVGVVVLDRDVTATLDAHFDDDLEVAVKIDPERWEDRGLMKRLGETLVNGIEEWL